MYLLFLHVYLKLYMLKEWKFSTSLHFFSPTPLPCQLCDAFKDKWTRTATVGSAALQQLHVWVLHGIVRPLYQNVSTTYANAAYTTRDPVVNFTAKLSLQE